MRTMRRRGNVALLLVVGALIGAVALAVVQAATSETAEVRISARRLGDGRVEFALQQRIAGEWNERELPDGRFFPPGAELGSWLNSTPLVIEPADPEPPYVAPDNCNDTKRGNLLATASLYTGRDAGGVVGLSVRRWVLSEDAWETMSTWSHDWHRTGANVQRPRLLLVSNGQIVDEAGNVYPSDVYRSVTWGNSGVYDSENGWLQDGSRTAVVLESVKRKLRPPDGVVGIWAEAIGEAGEVLGEVCVPWALPEQRGEPFPFYGKDYNLGVAYAIFHNKADHRLASTQGPTQWVEVYFQGDYRFRHDSRHNQTVVKIYEALER